eukprot:scaffold146_cov374-Prasinococcus_capsulatus_cf.AAC.20
MSLRKPSPPLSLVSRKWSTASPPLALLLANIVGANSTPGYLRAAAAASTPSRRRLVKQARSVASAMRAHAARPLAASAVRREHLPQPRPRARAPRATGPRRPPLLCAPPRRAPRQSEGARGRR